MSPIVKVGCAAKDVGFHTRTAGSMKTKPRRTCTSCGNQYTGALQFCPICMVREAIDWTAESGESSSGKTAQLPPQSITRRFGHYELATNEDGEPIELGRGGMGVTYKAFDVDLRYPVTLKVINERYLNDNSARHRFVREARAAASIRHPNVASVFHLGRIGERYFYAMEFVEGETLEEIHVSQPLASRDGPGKLSFGGAGLRLVVLQTGRERRHFLRR